MEEADEARARREKALRGVTRRAVPVPGYESLGFYVRADGAERYVCFYAVCRQRFTSQRSAVGHFRRRNCADGGLRRGPSLETVGPLRLPTEEASAEQENRDDKDKTIGA